MSFEAAAWAIRQPTKTQTEKLVLIGLCDCYNKHNSRCDPSNILLSQVAVCSERNISTALKGLESQGLITVVRVNGKRNNYQINITETPEDSSPHPRTDFGSTPEDVSEVPLNSVPRTPELSSETPELSSDKPVRTSKEPVRAIWEPDEETLIACKMSGVNVTDEMIATFRLKVLDWKDKNYNGVNLRTKFISHCKGVNLEKHQSNPTARELLKNEDW